MAEKRFKKILGRKRVGNIEYRLVSFAEGSEFIIYKWDLRIKETHKIPEVFNSRNEKEARDYLEAL